MLLGIDLGSQSCRSILLDEEGEVLSNAKRTYELRFVRRDWVEQNPNLWWEAAASAIKECIRKAKISADRVTGLGVSSQGNTPIPIDVYGNILRPAISWLDTRSISQTTFLSEKFPQDRLLHKFGFHFSPSSTTPKLLWIRDNEPLVFSKTHKFLLAEDYITFRLSNAFAVDLSLASWSLPFDIFREEWIFDVLDEIGLTPDNFSEPVHSGTVVGEVTTEASRKTGLKKGTAVVAGGHDQCCAAIGAGVVKKGFALNSIGTAQALLCMTDKPVIDPRRKLRCYFHATPNRQWVMLGTISSAGILLGWFRDVFCVSEREVARNLNVDTYSLLDKEAETVPPGSEGLLFFPYSSDSRGTILGLSLNHDKRHFVRAILEGIGFETRKMVERLEQLGIHRIEEIRMAGGGAKSTVWRRIVSDITNRKVSLPKVEEAASLGAAILAGVGTKVYCDVSEGIDRTVEIIEEEDPESSLHGKYASYYGLYRHLSEKVMSICYG